MELENAVAIMVAIIAVIFILGFLSTDVGAQWGTVQTAVAPFAVLIALAVIVIALVRRR